jgi:hypothetical protein
MNHRLAILLLPLMLLQCTYYNKAFKKDSQFYTDQEKRMLAETTTALTFSYGYDADIELEYVLYYPYTKQDFAAKENALQQLVMKYDNRQYIAFCEKMFYLRAVSAEQAIQYSRNKVWKYTTYINTYLIPPLDEYVLMLYKNLLIKVPEYGAVMEKRKLELLDDAAREVAFIEEIRQRRIKSKVVNGKKPK